MKLPLLERLRRDRNKGGRAESALEVIEFAVAVFIFLGIFGFITIGMTLMKDTLEGVSDSTQSHDLVTSSRDLGSVKLPSTPKLDETEGETSQKPSSDIVFDGWSEQKYGLTLTDEDKIRLESGGLLGLTLDRTKNSDLLSLASSSEKANPRISLACLKEWGNPNSWVLGLTETEGYPGDSGSKVCSILLTVQNPNDESNRITVPLSEWLDSQEVKSAD